MKKRQSFEAANEKGSPPESSRKRTSITHAHAPMGFNLLAEISNQTQPLGSGNGTQKEPLSRKLFPAKELSEKETGFTRGAESPLQPQRDTQAIPPRAQKMESPLKLPPFPPSLEQPTAGGSSGSGAPATTTKPVTRRFKSVEKPVKTLGIASEHETGASRHEAPPPSSHNQHLRAAEVPEKTSGSESGSDLPSWVSIAHVSSSTMHG